MRRRRQTVGEGDAGKSWGSCAGRRAVGEDVRREGRRTGGGRGRKADPVNPQGDTAGPALSSASPGVLGGLEGTRGVQTASGALGTTEAAALFLACCLLNPQHCACFLLSPAFPTRSQKPLRAGGKGSSLLCIQVVRVVPRGP